MSRTPLYARLLRLRRLHLTVRLRAALWDGPLVLGVLLALSDLASAWIVLVLPLAVAAVVKVHDVLAAQLAPPQPPLAQEQQVPG